MNGRCKPHSCAVDLYSTAVAATYCCPSFHSENRTSTVQPYESSSLVVMASWEVDFGRYVGDGGTSLHPKSKKLATCW